MRKTICTCDRCGKEITDGVVYTVTVYAEDVDPAPLGLSMETASQNTRQNLKRVHGEAELCKECKDELTDGIFIV